jgi:hypothetical protein
LADAMMRPRTNARERGEKADPRFHDVAGVAFEMMMRQALADVPAEQCAAHHDRDDHERDRNRVQRAS